MSAQWYHSTFPMVLYRKRHIVVLPVTFALFVFCFALAHSSYPGVSYPIHLTLSVSHRNDLLRHSMVPCCPHASRDSVLFHPEILQSCFKVRIKKLSWKFLLKNLYIRIVMECEVIGASIRGKWPWCPALILRYEFETYIGGCFWPAWLQMGYLGK